MLYRLAARAVLLWGLPCILAALCSGGCPREKTVAKTPAPVAARSGPEESANEPVGLQPTREEAVTKVSAPAVEATLGLDESSDELAEPQPAAAADEHNWDALLGDLKKTAAEKFPAAAEQPPPPSAALDRARDALKTLVTGLREEYAAGRGELRELGRAWEQLHSVELDAAAGDRQAD